MMKKRWHAATIGTALLFMALTGCSAEKEKVAETPPAPTNDLIEVVHTKISNVERFQLFLQNVDKGKPDTIRNSQITIEGDPIFQDVRYDGSKFDVTYDDSQDHFAGSGKGKKSTVCGRIAQTASENGTLYELADCTPLKSNFPTYLISIPAAK